MDDYPVLVEGWWALKGVALAVVTSETLVRFEQDDSLVNDYIDLVRSGVGYFRSLP